LIVRKKAVIHVSLCETHRRQRTLFIAGGWLLALAAIASFIVAGIQESGVWVLPGLVLLVTGIALGMTKGVLVAARRIDDQFIHLRGCCPEFLQPLPPWPR